MGVMDNCQFIPNTNQVNNDGVTEASNAKVGDVCDTDDDNDGVTDTFVADVTGNFAQMIAAATPGVMDNCHFVPNANQDNNDGVTEPANAKVGDLCDTDDDNDTITDTVVARRDRELQPCRRRRRRWARWITASSSRTPTRRTT